MKWKAKNSEKNNPLICKPGDLVRFRIYQPEGFHFDLEQTALLLHQCDYREKTQVFLKWHPALTINPYTEKLFRTKLHWLAIIGERIDLLLNDYIFELIQRNEKND